MTERSHCYDCPRRCGDGNYCRMPLEAVVARTGLHDGEEPCISGTRGSGTVFFAGCNLGCVFCQNREISYQPKDVYRDFAPDRLADAFRALEDGGAHNINLVTGSHYSSQILAALRLYRPSVPVVYNTSAYDLPDTIDRLAEFVSVWLPDLKFCDPALSARLCGAHNYFAVASAAIARMRKHAPKDEFDSRGLMQKGVLVRHLVLPSHKTDSFSVLNFVAALTPRPRISLMNQYFPAGDASAHPDIARKLTSYEYEAVVRYAQGLGLDGYTQSRASATSDAVPQWGSYYRPL